MSAAGPEAGPSSLLFIVMSWGGLVLVCATATELPLRRRNKSPLARRSSLPYFFHIIISYHNLFFKSLLHYHTEVWALIMHFDL